MFSQFQVSNFLDIKLDKILQKSVNKILADISSTFASEFDLNLVREVVNDLATECYALYSNFASEFHLLTGKDNGWVSFITSNIQIKQSYFALVERYLELVPNLCEEFPKLLILNSYSGNLLECRYYTREPMPNKQQQSLLLDCHLDKPIINRDEWYLVSTNWFKSWMKYTRSTATSDTPIEAPGPIDNSSLLQGLTLNPYLTPIIDFQLIPVEKWGELLSWYGLSASSIAIRRIALRMSVISLQSTIEIFPIYVKCSVIGREGCEVIRIGRTESVCDLLDKVKFALKIQSRPRNGIFIYKCTHEGNELLTDPGEQLEHANFLNRQDVCVELRC